MKYKREQLEFYRLADVRAGMLKHKYVDKQQVIQDRQQDAQEQWKWVFHIKPKPQQKYGRFWAIKHSKWIATILYLIMFKNCIL